MLSVEIPAHAAGDDAAIYSHLAAPSNSINRQPVQFDAAVQVVLRLERRIQREVYVVEHHQFFVMMPVEIDKGCSVRRKTDRNVSFVQGSNDEREARVPDLRTVGVDRLVSAKIYGLDPETLQLGYDTPDVTVSQEGSAVSPDFPTITMAARRVAVVADGPTDILKPLRVHVNLN